LLIVVVAIRRLNLYEAAYGLTMLRLYSELFSYWIGAVFLGLGATIAGIGRSRAWLLSAAAAAGLALLLALNVVNPEAVVAADQLAATHQVGQVDRSYLGILSDDAVPAIAGRLAALDPSSRVELRAELCASAAPPRFTGWAAWNLDHQRAEASLDSVCR